MDNKDQIISKVSTIATKYGWQYLKTSDWVVIFYKNYEKDRAQINVYWNAKGLNSPGKMQFTVQTCVNHPKHGKTQLNRRNIGYSELEKIFDNPRLHTGKGYYKKKS